MTGLELLAGIGGAGQALSGVLGPILGYASNNNANAALLQATNVNNLTSAYNTEQTNKTNAENVEKTNAANLQIARDTNAMNERLQREQWQRDDTSYQRMAKDMSAAGLNPLSSFSSPVSSSLSTQMNGATMQAAQAQAMGSLAVAPIRPFDFSNLGSGFGDFANSILKQKELNMQNKALNLKAITSGVNPIYLDDASNSDELVNFFRNIFDANLQSARANAKEAQKTANSPYVKGEGIVSKLSKDILQSYESVRGAVKSASGNDLNDVPKALKSIKAVPSSQVIPPKETLNRKQEYYYNLAQKNKNTKSRAFGNWIRSKVFKR